MENDELEKEDKKKKKKKKKYNSSKVIIDWYTFDSNLEAKYYQEVLKKYNIPFTFHERFVIQDSFMNWKKILPIYYEADFSLIIEWKITVIDVKGMATPDALIKRKMFLYRYWDIELKRITYCKKRWGWIDFFVNKKEISKEKSAKK
jgi:hypothetical protein